MAELSAVRAPVISTIVNQRPAPLILHGDTSSIRLAPLERRIVTEDTVAGFDLQRAVKDGSLVTVSQLETEPPNLGAQATVAIFVGLVVAGSLADKVNGDTVYRSADWLIALGAAVGVFVVLTVATVWLRRPAPLQAFRLLAGWGKQLLVLLVVLAVGVAVPVLVILLSSELGSLEQARAALGGDRSERVLVIAHLLQAVFVSLAALLPALLYFLFDRQQSATLRDGFVRNAFRLDSAIGTVSELRAKYGQRMVEAYGVEDARGVPRTRHLRQSPIMLTSLLMTIFWILTLVDSGASGSAFTSVLTPAPAAIVFGFLGAYVFALFALLRSYLRKDLRPKTYSLIAARLLLVAALAWVFEQLLSPSTTLNVAMFVIGIVPQSAVQYLNEVVMGWVLKHWRSDLRDPAPLTTIDGIDIYERLRLEEEGVTNVEALAHHDLVDLLLETRIPAARLVDWVDQAILQLYVPPRESEADCPGLHEKLRCIGVRTATDLLQLCSLAQQDPGAMAALRGLGTANGDPGAPPTAAVVAASMADDQWIGALMNWRRDPPPRPHRVNCRTTVAIRANGGETPTSTVTGGGLPDMLKL